MRYYKTASFSGRLKPWDEPEVPVQQQGRPFPARYPGTCAHSGRRYEAGTLVVKTPQGYVIRSEIPLPR